MQISTSIDANVYIYKCKFTYANICIFIRRAEGWGGGGAWQAGRQGGAQGYCASRGRERATRRLRASRVTATQREAASDGRPARGGAGGPPLRSSRPCGAKRRGAAAEWGRQRKPRSVVACLRWRPLSVPPLLARCLRVALPLLAWLKAAVALRASLPACGGAALGRAAAAPAFRPPPRFRVSGGWFPLSFLYGSSINLFGVSPSTYSTCIHFPPFSFITFVTFILSNVDIHISK